MAKPSAELTERFAALVGKDHALHAMADMAPYLAEARGRYEGSAALVLRPATTQEVCNIVKLAHESGTALVPQGGNTGLVAGGVPFESGEEIIVSLSRLNRLRNLDPLANSVTVEAGMTLAAVQAHAATADRLFPLSMASEGSCEIGGNLATNAGGTAVLHYGNARDLVLGLEVVLADGSLWNGLKNLRKDNTGYDLKQIFIGSEGTLGIITAATLKLFPRPRSMQSAYVALADVAAAVKLLRLVQAQAAGEVTGFELISAQSLDLVLRHIPRTANPLDRHAPWYALLELSSGADQTHLRQNLEAILSNCLETGDISDAALAQSEEQRTQFWRLRESIPEAQRKEGASIKHDVSLPIGEITNFIGQATEAVHVFDREARPVIFGHIGDGNIHFNVSQPIGGQAKRFLERWDELNRVIHDIVHEMGGSISAEHGIGRMKCKEFARYKDPVEIALMKTLKTSLDPKNILNPGVLWQS